MKAFATLEGDASLDSSEFLVALCYHHADHGELERRAFKCLADRAAKFSKPDINDKSIKGNMSDTICSMLFDLLYTNCTCTIGQSVAALTTIKHPQCLNVLTHLLSQDLNEIFSMNIADLMAKLGDRSELIL